MKMQTAIVENKSSESKLAHLTAKAAEGKILAEDLVELGKRKAERLLKDGLEVGEDYLDESRRFIKHHPWQSVGIAAGAGAIVGLLLGWRVTRPFKA